MLLLGLLIHKLPDLLSKRQDCEVYNSHFASTNSLQLLCLTRGCTRSIRCVFTMLLLDVYIRYALQLCNAGLPVL